MVKVFKFIVVDDHPIVRRGLVESLRDEADFEVIAEGGSADDAVRLAETLVPDLIVLDVNMPGSGVEAARRICAAVPRVVILMFSFRQDIEIVQACQKAGAKGYIVKGASSAKLNGAIRQLLAGQTYIDPVLTGLLGASTGAASD